MAIASAFGQFGTSSSQLSAILAADVAGYSRLMGLDEEGTLARLKELRRTLIDPKISEPRERIVKTMGDGLLLQFGSVVDAVRCAADIQRLMIEQQGGTAEDRRIEFRMGIKSMGMVSMSRHGLRDCQIQEPYA